MKKYTIIKSKGIFFLWKQGESGDYHSTIDFASIKDAKKYLKVNGLFYI